MKALFFNQDLFMGMREIEYPPQEFRFLVATITKTIELATSGEPQETPYLVYQLDERSRNYVIYKLKGIEE